MKIRTDYVSNSSSSSFIVVLTPNYPFNEFVSDVVYACSESSDIDYGKEFLSQIDKINSNNLTYCLNTFELSFLGCVSCDPIRSLFITDDIYGIPLSKNKMRHLSPKTYLEGKKEIEDDKTFCAQKLIEISKRAEQCSDIHNDDIYLFEITKNTVSNTKLLLELNYKLTLPKWCENLDAIEERLNKGERIFSIRMNQGGDGITSGTIYATNGWDSDFNSKANVEVLHSSVL